MHLRTKACNECGVPIDAGFATCTNCGAPTGTVFSEAAPLPSTNRVSNRQRIDEQVHIHNTLTRARERANHSLIYSLVAFFPVVGFLLGPTAIYMAVTSVKTLKAFNVEEGRGVATAGIVISLLALLAQFSYLLLAASSKSGMTNLFGL
ncbi:MAG TPA: hypothetical protein VJX67_20425 [Blastocatellia bacterium]|nr:hypothetical protein [Blastocatellia bacterium]